MHYFKKFFKRGFFRPFLVAQRSGRTPIKSTIWSHDGQKDRFVIFGHGAPKMGKKSWRETFGTIGVKIRSISRPKFWKFDPWSNLRRTKPRFWSTLDKSTISMVSCTKCINDIFKGNELNTGIGTYICKLSANIDKRARRFIISLQGQRTNVSSP